jgi:glycosyltransferase 2 family protein
VTAISTVFSRRPRRLEPVVKVVITLGLLGFLFSKVDVAATAGQILSVGAGAFTISATIVIVLSLLVSIRWQLILHAMNSPLRLWECWRLVMIGLFFNQTLPTSIGGDVVRIWLSARSVTLRAGFVSIVLDRLFALVGLGICVIAALPLLLIGPAANLAIFISLSAVLGAIGLLAFDAAADSLSPIASRLFGNRVVTATGRPVAILRDLSRIFRLILRRRVGGTAVIGISIINQLSLGLVVYIIAGALGSGLSLINTILTFPVAMLLSMAPISFGGWGVREASMVWLLGALGISSQEALSVSILFGLATTAAGLPGGLLWLVERPSKTPPRTHTAASLGAASVGGPRVISSRSSRLSAWVTIVERQVDFGDGRFETYHALNQSDYVAIFAVTPDQRIPIVRQYRPALERFTWELPAGRVEPDEDAATACVREFCWRRPVLLRRACIF